MKIELLSVGILLFILGFSVSSMLTGINERVALGGVEDKDNPSDFFSSSDIHLYQDKLVVSKQGLQYASVADTKSMEPLLSANSHVIEAKADVGELNIGDIISFTKKGQVMVHSIFDIGSDSKGWYALTKGYNTDFIDDWKVREFEIKGVVVGVLN